MDAGTHAGAGYSYHTAGCKSLSMFGTKSEESEKILEEYRVENDIVLSFLTDADIIKTIYNCDIKREVMYKLYRSHCQYNALKPLTKNIFYKELREKYQFQEKHKNGNTEIVFYRELPVTKK